MTCTITPSVDAQGCPGGITGYQVIIRNKTDNSIIFDTGMQGSSTVAVGNGSTPYISSTSNFSSIEVDTVLLGSSGLVDGIDVCTLVQTSCGTSTECCHPVTPDYNPPTITCTINCA